MWQEENNALVRTFTFPDFRTALEFVNKIGAAAERLNHHPDIQLSWGKVVITLTSHDQGKITDKDRELAAAIDNI
jgi:4a-hydroxytetrahydrobiopterin dehydratase